VAAPLFIPHFEEVSGNGNHQRYFPRKIQAVLPEKPLADHRFDCRPGAFPVGRVVERLRLIIRTAHYCPQKEEK